MGRRSPFNATPATLMARQTRRSFWRNSSFIGKHMVAGLQPETRSVGWARFFMVRLFALFRTVIYATLFIGFVLVYWPLRVAFASGIPRPHFALPQLAGLVIATMGGAIALWCVVSHVIIG